MRCLYWGIHLTTGLCDQSSCTLGHKMSLPKGRVRLTFCSIGSQPARQLASCNWPAKRSCDKYQPVRLQVGQIVGGRRIGAQPHWASVQGPSTPTGSPWGSDLPDQGPGKWHKWALQPIIYCWHYFQGPFAVLYLCHFITYSCMKCRKMLYRLYSLQTNLLHILPPSIWCITTPWYYFQGTTFIITNQKCCGSLTKGQPAWSSNTLGHEMSLLGKGACGIREWGH